MALDKISGLGLNFNPFVKPKDQEDASTSTKTRGIGYEHINSPGKRLAKGIEKNSEKRPDGISFLPQGALGHEDALYVKGGRAGAKQNFIA